MAAVEYCWKKNKNLGHYNFAYNNIFDNEGLQKIIEWLGPYNHIFKVEVSERAGDQYAALQEALSNNKPKKGKKGKKGKKKKKWRSIMHSTLTQMLFNRLLGLKHTYAHNYNIYFYSLFI